MRNLILIVVASLFIFSCKKNETNNIPNPPVIPDTLTAGWTKATTPTAMGNGTDIYFANATTGFTTTSSGIFKSTDGGVNWSFFNTNNTAYNIGGYGTKYCFVGNTNTISYTTNSNDFFTVFYNLANPNTPQLTFRDCHFPSQNIAYACSGRYIYKSTNGGVNFDSIYVFAEGDQSNAIFFVNDFTGWLARSNGLYKTTDGGLSWNRHPITTNFSQGGSIDFIDANVGVMANLNNVYKTSDGGITWSIIYINPVSGYIDVDMISANEMYFKANDRVFKSVDGGSIWQKVLSSNQNGIAEIHFIDSNTGWACGSGVVYRYKL